MYSLFSLNNHNRIRWTSVLYLQIEHVHSCNRTQNQDQQQRILIRHRYVACCRWQRWQIFLWCYPLLYFVLIFRNVYIYYDYSSTRKTTLLIWANTSHGGWFSLIMHFYQHTKHYCEDKMILRMSYFHNGIFYREAIFIVNQVRQHDDKPQRTQRKLHCVFTMIYMLVILYFGHKTV